MRLSPISKVLVLPPSELGEVITRVLCAKQPVTSIDHRGFNDVTTPNGVFYQSWSNGKPTINTGTTGLVNFGMSS